MIHNNVESAIRELFSVGGHLEAAAKKIAKDSSRIVHRSVTSEIIQLNLLASRNLLKSVTQRSLKSVRGSSFETAVMTNSLSSDYADVVEEGRRPNRKAPPVDRILKWMTLKGLQPDLQGAWMISRKIGKQGIPGKHPFKKGMEKSIPAIQVAAEIEISQALSNSKFLNVNFNPSKNQFVAEIAS